MMIFISLDATSVFIVIARRLQYSTEKDYSLNA